MQTDSYFGGFDRSSTTPIPDSLFDEALSTLTGAELKVLLYILRRTLGFGKDADTISLSQFEHGIVTSTGRVLDRGCGLHRETITRALQSLERSGYIVSEKRFSPQGEREITRYQVRFQEQKKVVRISDHQKRAEPNGHQTSHPQGIGKPDHQAVGYTDQDSRKTWKPVVGKPDPQETVEQPTDSQKTERNRVPATRIRGRMVPPSSLARSAPQALSSSLSEKETMVWLWWKAKKSLDDSALTPAAQEHLAALAEHLPTVAQLESLYQFVSEELQRYATSQNRPWVAPHLKNLVKRFPAWNATQLSKTTTPAKKVVSGSGSMNNWTRQRLEGRSEAPPLVYPPVERRSGKPMNNLAATIQRHSISVTATKVLDEIPGINLEGQ